MKGNVLFWGCTLGAWIVCAAPTNDVVTARATNGVAEHAVAPLVVTASRVAEPLNKVAASAEKISDQQLHEEQARTFPEALDRMSGVMVQKTSYGQGSPYIRGFTGFRTLAMVDGIRLNSPVFRDGPNQYWSTVDSLALDSVEVLKGAGSTLYGSDAIGGTVQAFTRMPEYTEEGDSWGGRLYARGSSAERSAMTRTEGEYATDQWAGIVGASYKYFGDLQGGHAVGRQEKTGYDEFDYDMKFRIRMRDDKELFVAHQQVTQNDVWRTHRTPYGVSWHGTTVGNEKEHIFDQKRALTYLRFNDQAPNWAYDELTVTAYWQRQLEDKRVVKSNNTAMNDGFRVDTWGGVVDALKGTSIGTWAYGTEYVYDDIGSYRFKYKADGSWDSLGIQGPVADDSGYHTIAFYVQDRVELSDRWDWTVGARSTVVRSDIGQFENLSHGGNSGYSDHMNDEWFNVSGHTRLGYQVIEDYWLLYGALSQAFRAPNLSDLTRYDASGSNDIEIPSSDLDPERYVTGELGSRVTLDAWAWHIAYFYTDIRDLIIRRKVGVSGSSSMYQSSNASKGYIHGVETESSFQLSRQFQIRGGMTWMEGYSDYDQITGERVEEPIRTMPLTGFGALRWESINRRFWAEIAEVAVDKEDRLTAKDRSDTQRIPPGGTPGYMVTDLRVGWRVWEGLSLVFGIENLLDKDYRIHGSGSNEPGRNYVLSADYRF